MKKHLVGRLQHRIWLLLKAVRQRFMAKQQKIIIFIVGCQRSGTTLLANIFEQDSNSKVFHEVSEITSMDTTDYLRFKPLQEVQAVFQACHAPLIISKPLVETQRANELLGFFPNSKAIWLFRNYSSVASSNLKKFGVNNGLQDLQPIIRGDLGNWRAENINPETASLIKKCASGGLLPADAAVLFWYSRNALFFDQKLDQNTDVLLCKYEDLVQFPELIVPALYKQLGYRYPGERILSEIHAQSVNKGLSTELSPAIRQLADEMFSSLCERCSSQEWYPIKTRWPEK